MSALGCSAPHALPTLLTSRPQLPPWRKGGRPEPEPQPKLPEAYSMPICIHNTFIDTPAELSPSLASLLRERQVKTCPSAHIGRLRDLFNGLDAGSCKLDEVTQTRLPSEDPETRSASEASSPSSAAAPHVCVLSLAGLLGPPSEPPPAHALGDEGISAVAHAACRWGEEALGDGAFRSNQIFWSAAQPIQEVVPAPPAAAPVAFQELPAVPAPPADPAPGSAELPSIGSAGHAAGCCKPCAFFHTVGCTSGLTCQFCHLCDADERKRRRMAKLDARRADRLRRSSEAGSEREEHAGSR